MATAHKIKRVIKLETKTPKQKTAKALYVARKDQLLLPELRVNVTGENPFVTEVYARKVCIQEISGNRYDAAHGITTPLTTKVGRRMTNLTTWTAAADECGLKLLDELLVMANLVMYPVYE